MEIGGFFFEFPVWIIHATMSGKNGFSFCEVEGQDCLSVFTDEALVESYLEKHPFEGDVTMVDIESADELADLLEDRLDDGSATHIAIDPEGNAFVWPINQAIPILRGGK